VTDALDVLRVPGSWELPVLARRLAAGGSYAAIVALAALEMAALFGGLPA
jgi:6,7-dimethyl-8-ribityllumazine synthase